MSLRSRCPLTLITLGLCCTLADAQPPGGGFGPGAGGRPPGPMGGKEIELVEDFDTDHNGWLDRDERAAARKALAERPRGGRRGEGRGGRRGGFGPPGGGPLGGGPPGGGPRGGGRRGPPGGDFSPPKPGPRVEKSEVATFSGADLYDPDVVRTLFLDFETDDWEAELQDFKGTDVEVPAKLTVDGVEYPGVGVHFRGMSSFMMIPAGSKRSLNVSLNFIDKDQRLEGYKTLNLLNGNGDPSMMSTVLYSEIAREHTPAPRANFVRVVINGESWGVYTNVQQFDKVFTKENYGSSKGTRWKVPGSPGADGGLRYLGEELEPYKQRYEMKSDDGDEEWRSLVDLSRVLNETPLEQLEEKLAPILDIDDTLWFLALDVSLVNSDGYWTRASDYYLFRDSEGVFHPIPHDMNEAFRGGGHPGHGGPGRGGPGGSRGFGPPDGRDGPPGGGFGGFFGPPPTAERADRDAGRPDQRGGRRGFGPPGGGPPGGQRGGPPGGMHGGVDLDPLVGLDNERTPLRGRLLAIPHLRERYLGYVRQIAAESLGWDHLGPRVAHYRQLIREAVEQDTRKLSTTEAFDEATAPATPPKASTENLRGRSTSLRQFSEARSGYLLKGESD